jgi:putative isomerase
MPKGADMSWGTLPLKVKLFTGFLPMWCGIATPEQASVLVGCHLRNPAEFSAEWGVPSLARNEKMYAPQVNSSNPSNWLGPVWLVADFMVYEGLLRYGFAADARNLADKTVRLLQQDLEQTGTLHECYHPETGKPNFNSGFLSWNVLAALMAS